MGENDIAQWNALGDYQRREPKQQPKSMYVIETENPQAIQLVKIYLRQQGYATDHRDSEVSFYEGEQVLKGASPLGTFQKAENGIIFTIPDGNDALEKIVKQLGRDL